MPPALPSQVLLGLAIGRHLMPAEELAEEKGPGVAEKNHGKEKIESQRPLLDAEK